MYFLALRICLQHLLSALARYPKSSISLHFYLLVTHSPLAHLNIFLYSLSQLGAVVALLQ